MIQFAVLGKAQPAGSKKSAMLMPIVQAALRAHRGGLPEREAIRRILGATRIVDANKNAAKWKESVAGVALAEMNGRAPLTGPISLGLMFLFERPASHLLADGFSLSAAGRRFPCHTQKPDALKLARGVEDALAGVVYVDDAQIVDEAICKRWCEPNEREQVVISVKPYADNLIAALLEGVAS